MTERQRHALANSNANSALALLEENMKAVPCQDIAEISNAILESEDNPSPDKICKILKQAGCRRPKALLHSAAFFTVSKVLARRLEEESSE